ncbi:MAG: hypothetical protein AAFX08_10330 [Pseudomonadota bacterium]
MPRRAANAAPPAASVRLRLALVGGLALAVLAPAFLFAKPTATLAQDADLARLLRAMAALKLIFVVGLAAAVWARFAWPTSARLAVVYVLCAASSVGALTMIMKLSLVGPAALAFHASFAAAFVTAHFDRGLSSALQGVLGRADRFGRSARRP